MADQRLINLFNWYDSLNTLERLALHCWLVRGDVRLLDALRHGSERLKRFDYQPFTVCQNQTLFHSREFALSEMVSRLISQA
jgi:hypothetical protein